MDLKSEQKEKACPQTPAEVPSKVYTSIFVPEHKIDIANYITELLVSNFCDWQRIRKPQSPFWRKDIIENDSTGSLKKLRDRYIAELSQVKEMLSVFSPAVLMADINKNNRIGFRMIKKENRDKIIVKLYIDQVKYIKTIEGINKSSLERAEDKRPFMGTSKFAQSKNKLGKL